MSSWGRSLPAVALATLLVVLLLICASQRSAAIEQDLMLRAQRTLDAENIPYYDLDFDGRDAILGGGAPSRDAADRIVELVAAVPGVRQVRDLLSVPTAASRGADHATAALEPPVLRLSRGGRRVTVNARLPETVRSEWTRAAESQGLDAGGSGGWVFSDDVADLTWTRDASTLGALLDLLDELDDNARLVVRGTSASLWGQVPDDDDARAIRDRSLGAFGDLSWTFQLFLRGGMPASARGGN